MFNLSNLAWLYPPGTRSLTLLGRKKDLERRTFEGLEWLLGNPHWPTTRSSPSAWCVLAAWEIFGELPAARICLCHRHCCSASNESISLKKKYIYIYWFLGSAGSLRLSVLFSTCSEWELLSNCSAGFSLWWLLSLWTMGSRVCRLQYLQFPGLWSMGLVAPWHVGSSQSRDRTRVSCTGRRIPISVPPGKPQEHCFKIVNLQFDFNCA